MLEMFHLRCAVDEDVVEEDEDEAAKKVAEDAVHHSLERRGSVREAERHDQELEVAVVCSERRLGDVVRVHQHLVIATAEIQLGEDTGTLEFVQELINHRDREFVLHGLRIESTIVDTKSLKGTLFADEEHR
jgi:hydrogenase maturation factor